MFGAEALTDAAVTESGCLVPGWHRAEGVANGNRGPSWISNFPNVTPPILTIRPNLLEVILLLPPQLQKDSAFAGVTSEFFYTHKCSASGEHRCGSFWT